MTAFDSVLRLVVDGVGGRCGYKKGSFLTYKGDNSIARYHALQKNSHRKKCTHTLTEEHHTGTSGRLFLQVGVYDIHE